ncbi:MAG: M23 family metallopeptidase [Actinobacteria bacterium]|nr:M23 family metallopeptidase [Actinomycetota bacterium]
MQPTDAFTARSLPGGTGGPKRPLFAAPRRRARRVAAFVAVALLVSVPLIVAGGGGGPATGAVPGAAPARAGAAPSALAADDPDTDALAQPFALIGRLTLVLPGEEVLLVGYHEASFADAVALQPHGHGLANENTTKFTLPPPEDGPGYLVLSSRGRPQPATSAVDLVMHDDETVTSPVTGTVVLVEPYTLYGKYPDTRIEIAPEDAPHLRVVLIHVREVTVASGDRVEAGVSVLAAGPNRFPFASHIDRYFPEDRWPHVHLEVKPADAVRPVGAGG